MKKNLGALRKGTIIGDGKFRAASGQGEK